MKTLPHIRFVRADGGRAHAGFKGKAPGDCAARAFAIAASRPYRETYDRINELAKLERHTKRKYKSTARDGVHRKTAATLAIELGATWVPVMKIGSGCKMHVRADELPLGRLVLSLSKHYVAVIDRVLYDNHDSSRNGTRCVYGYWVFPGGDHDQ